MTRSKKVRGLILGFGVVALLAACAQEPVSECEPGVSEISEMGTVTPPGC
ncbi:hypothetical protein [Rhodovulum adriaticum]|uniref:Lipoprotein n=1 Tax=Rhodovulum adriaticum TaxID=35804 RepID=A0A4R2NJC5_RHOAD|nr:hypothetical protein [Rhodovulum adriaticum]TCP21224.1 hypothetical protein EV656_11240 [Rhodovulum adriaticum]